MIRKRANRQFGIISALKPVSQIAENYTILQVYLSAPYPLRKAEEDCKMAAWPVHIRRKVPEDLASDRCSSPRILNDKMCEKWPICDSLKAMGLK